MKFNKLYTILSESPIVDFENFPSSKGDSEQFSNADRKYLANPEGIKAFKDSFKNFDFNMYFMTDPLFAFGNGPKILSKDAFKGTTVMKGQEQVWSKISKSIKPNVITCLFRGNVALNAMPITPWQQAHRIGHVLATVTDTEFNKKYYYMAANELRDAFLLLIYQKHPEFRDLLLHGATYDNFVYGMEDYKKVTHPFMNLLGTFKSARQNNVRSFYEFLFEVIAQFLVTGKVTLRKDVIPELEQQLSSKESNINQYLANLFDEMKGYFVYVSF